MCVLTLLFWLSSTTNNGGGFFVRLKRPNSRRSFARARLFWPKKQSGPKDSVQGTFNSNFYFKPSPFLWVFYKLCLFNPISFSLGLKDLFWPPRGSPASSKTFYNWLRAAIFLRYNYFDIKLSLIEILLLILYKNVKFQCIFYRNWTF